MKVKKIKTGVLAPREETHHLNLDATPTLLSPELSIGVCARALARLYVCLFV